jgi:WD40 repeat protein
LDFEHGARAAMTPSQYPDMRENEALKRVYVASKSGMVFQVNYATETLEATYKTNDSSIFSIACNEAFCVTGSEDKFLRVWPLDFSEFVMEAKHEGTVCSVDISADGLRVVCGTLYGSLGVLDKSNQRYRTLIRAHTEKILSMDFHLALRNIITVSEDGTIRLWDLQNFEQVIEFNSPLEQPLCVAAHPTLPLFSCGFKTGTMRVFDIEKTCVASDFTQFNKPLRALAYSPTGDMLVTCCEDGSFAIHNARRQHLPTKMMHLDFPPQHVHVAFSPVIVRQKMMLRHTKNQLEINEDNFDRNDSKESEHHESEHLTEALEGEEIQNYYETMFAVMGEYGNSVMIYSSDSIVLRHHI